VLDFVLALGNMVHLRVQGQGWSDGSTASGWPAIGDSGGSICPQNSCVTWLRSPRAWRSWSQRSAALWRRPRNKPALTLSRWIDARFSRPPGLHARGGVLERASRDDAGVGRLPRSASIWVVGGSADTTLRALSRLKTALSRPKQGFDSPWERQWFQSLRWVFERPVLRFTNFSPTHKASPARS
jgi:hypothetical protein